MATDGVERPDGTDLPEQVISGSVDDDALVHVEGESPTNVLWGDYPGIDSGPPPIDPVTSPADESVVPELEPIVVLGAPDSRPQPVEPAIDPTTDPVTDSVVPELAPYPTAAGVGRPAARWLWVGGVGVLGLVLVAGLFVFGGSGDGDGDGGVDDDAVALPDATSAAAADPTTPSVATPVATADTTQSPPSVSETTAAVAVDAPALPDVLFAEQWSYTATKTADLVPAPDFITPDPVGVSYPGLLLAAQVCEGDVCRYESRYDLERTFLDAAEVGERAPAVWQSDGSSWSVDLAAHTMQSQVGETTCVVLLEESWDVEVTGAESEGRWVATGFTGTLVRRSSIDLTVSTGGADVCGDWQLIDEWSVSAAALS